MPKKECIAMVLAGGQGTRLGLLTKDIAKPVVDFGGKYKIIDFTLSNCSNSGLDVVGVLTQYQPFELNSHIGIGSHWNLNRKDGGVYILPPYVAQEGFHWYKGTADAIYQNMRFIEYYNPEYVVILSGDHIYRMDYNEVLEFHKQKKATATITVSEVPWEEASNFGVMHVGDDDEILEFQEKPLKPKSNLASMGIYIFNWKILKKYLEMDVHHLKSEHDFGKNIIPAMLRAGEKMSAYHFSGYWRDVGTVESYWQANMDFLAENPKLNLHDSQRQIYSVQQELPPSYIGESGNVRRALISEGSVILGEVYNSILFPGVHIEKGAKVVDSILLPNVRVKANSFIKKAIIGNDTIIGENCRIEHTQGQELNGIYHLYPSGIVLLSSNLKIPKDSTLGKTEGLAFIS